MSVIQNIQESLKGLSVEELLVFISTAAAEAKKAAKAVSKAPKEPKEKKGSMPKGVLPKQLQMSFAWVDYVLNHAKENGWESFEIKGQEKPMAASVLKDGQHVFEETGKPFNRKFAMSLSKYYWSAKEGKGARKDIYDAFEMYYVPPAQVAQVVSEEANHVVEEVKEPKEAKEEAPKKEKKAPAPKKTEEEKQAEKEAKALAKAAEKEAEKLKKAQEKAAEKAAKEAEKAAKAAAPKTVAKKAVKEEAPEFHCDEGEVRPWDFKSKKFLRDSDGNLWHRTDDGQLGEWAGKFDPATNTIDASADEPVFVDEE